MVLACCNALGKNELKLLFIGKSEKPLLPKLQLQQHFQVGYNSQKSVWMGLKTT
jgi:hypothetical protein